MRQVRALSPDAPSNFYPAASTDAPNMATMTAANGFTTLPRASLSGSTSSPKAEQQQLLLENDRNGFSFGLPLEGASDMLVVATGDSANSTGRGILIGVLSAFGSAIIAVLLLTIFFFFRYTQRGRIMLDRLGRPGEYDDEQAFAQEEAAALENMDDISRSEYLRAKGMYSVRLRFLSLSIFFFFFLNWLFLCK